MSSKNFIFTALISIFLFGTSPLFAKENYINTSLGLAKEEFTWNIAGDITGQNPNIVSELTWRDLDILQISLDVKQKNKWGWVGVLNARYGSILDGEAQDSDYNGDNRTDEYSRSISKADDGSVTFVSLGFGWDFELYQRRHVFTPLLGYAYFRQQLSMTDGVQTITSPQAAPLGPIDGLNNKYRAKWRGPLAGFDYFFKISDPLLLFFDARYYYLDYEAEGEWNLRPDFEQPRSFEHSADGDGYKLGVSLEYRILPSALFTLGYQYQKFKAHDGIDTLYRTDGTRPLAKLNEVKWKSSVVTIGIKKEF
jgi:hypothetical protein